MPAMEKIRSIAQKMQLQIPDQIEGALTFKSHRKDIYMGIDQQENNIIIYCAIDHHRLNAEAKKRALLLMSRISLQKKNIGIGLLKRENFQNWIIVSRIVKIENINDTNYESYFDSLNKLIEYIIYNKGDFIQLDLDSII